MSNRAVVAVAVFALTVVGCSPEPEGAGGVRGLAAGEGYVEVEGGRIWYEIVGSGDATPLVLVHGGPGATSHYLRPLARLAGERPVVFYDQLGCGRSDRPEDASLWTVERHVDELERLRDALGIDRFHLFGHSWGTMLAVEYYGAHPSAVASMILASPALDVPQWLIDTAALKAELPEDIREAIDRHEAAGTTDAEEYRAATMAFYRRYLCRLDPWPDELNAAFADFGTAVYETMWGPSEFHATGVLKDFDATGRLGSIDVPVLFTAGRYDEARPETVAGFQQRVPGARLQIFEQSSHMSMLEEPDDYAEALRQFLRDVEPAGAR